MGRKRWCPQDAPGKLAEWQARERKRTKRQNHGKKKDSVRGNSKTVGWARVANKNEEEKKERNYRMGKRAINSSGVAGRILLAVRNKTFRETEVTEDQGRGRAFWWQGQRGKRRARVVRVVLLTVSEVRNSMGWEQVKLKERKGDRPAGGFGHYTEGGTLEA